MNLQSQELPKLMSQIPLNQTEICQSKLNIEQKERSNLFPWNGQFSPQLVEALLNNYAFPKTKIFDPFLGSGTILAEAASRNLEAIGTEINPAAFQFASTYSICNAGIDHRELIIQSLENTISKVLEDAVSGHPVADELLLIYKKIRQPETKSLMKTLLLLLDYKTKSIDAVRVRTVWQRLKKVVLGLPTTSKRQIALNRDARNTGLKNSYFDLVITSPPYINVFNYHQNYRATSEEFGHDLLEVAKSEIGSNRKHRGNRFLTVIQYILDMTAVFDEIRRICTDDARIIFVVGRESNVRKTRFLNGEIVTNVATRCSDFTPILRQERVFTNRFGEKIFEDILHFEPQENSKKVDPFVVALETLQTARGFAPQEAMSDLADAILRINDVKPSPQFVQESQQEVRA